MLFRESSSCPSKERRESNARSQLNSSASNGSIYPPSGFASTGDPNAKDTLAEKLEIDLGAWDGPEHNIGVRLKTDIWNSASSQPTTLSPMRSFWPPNISVDARCRFGVDQI